MAAFEPITLLVSDIHGEYDTFSHVLRSAGGRLRSALGDQFAQKYDEAFIDELATLIFYPEEKLALDPELATKLPLVNEALTSLFPEATPLDNLVCACKEIQRLAVKRVHIVGDIYDRGPKPELAMDEIATLDNADIQWGNHDILWMGAALGQPGCVCHAARICARYGNLSILEDNYGMDLSALRSFAEATYADDPCVAFGLKGNPDLSEEETLQTVHIQKALAYLQCKVEAKLIDENPSFGLDNRKLLHMIDYERGTIMVDGVEYEMKDTVFPTIDPADPYRLTPEEEAIMQSLIDAFLNCEKLQRHVRLFLDKGSLYTIDGNDLIFHACVPLNADGSLKEVSLFGETYKGKALFDAVDSFVRDAYLEKDPTKRKRGLDMIWYLWLGPGSPLFAKSKMATLEIYLIADKAASKEVKNAFYSLLEDENAHATIVNDFGMNPETTRIVCGHVPVKVKDGENPLKCGGKIAIIDGGMSVPYQATSGIGGLVLIEDTQGAELIKLKPFAGREATVATNAQLETM